LNRHADAGPPVADELKGNDHTTSAERDAPTDDEGVDDGIQDPPDRCGIDVETDRSMAFGDRDVAGLGPVVTRCNLAAFRGSAKV
jgi:hypothetical protein